MTPGVGTRHVAPCTHPRLAGMPLHSTTLGAPVVVVAAVVVAVVVTVSWWYAEELMTAWRMVIIDP